MRKILLTVAILATALHLMAQSDLPTYGYNYQAIIRDAVGKPAANQSAQLRFQILNGTNAKLYEEKHSVATDAFGHATSVVGAGKCAHCRQPITTETGWGRHHLHPKHLGGNDADDNLVLLHPNCHEQVHHEGLHLEPPVKRRRTPQKETGAVS